MEINRQVCALRTTLSHIEKSLTCSFTAINARHLEAENCVHKLSTDLRVESFFIDKNDEQLRKLHLLLLINTDLSISAELENDCGVGHAVGAIPRMSTYLYFLLTYRYKLFRYLIEVIEHGPILMVLELINLVNSEIKYVRGSDYFKFIVLVLVAMISRLRRTDCPYILKKLHEQFQVLMLHYKENMDDKDTKKTDEKIESEGYRFLNLITFLRAMTNICFGTVKELQPLTIYDISIPVDATQWYPKHELKEKSVIIQECYEIVFFKCRDIMADLDVNMFITWHELQFLEDKTLQNVIGEEVYHLCQVLEQKRHEYPLPATTTDLISMLQSLAVKPAVSTLNIDKSNTAQLEWMILEKKTFDESFLKSMECFLLENRFKFDVVSTFVHKLCNVNNRPDVDNTVARNVIMLALKGLSLAELIVFLSEFIGSYGKDHILVDPNLDCRPFIEELNELYSNIELEEEHRREKEKEMMKRATLFAFQASCRTLSTLIKEGCLEKNRTSSALKMFEALSPICLYRSASVRNSSLLIDVLTEFMKTDFPKLSPAEKNNFFKLMTGLSVIKLVSGEKFLIICVLPLLYLEENTDYNVLADQLKLFEEFYSICDDKLTPTAPIILIQLAQILEDSRWYINSFSTDRMKVCERVIDAIELVKESFTWHSITGERRKWFEKHVSRFSNLTKSYFMNIVPSILLDTIESQLITFIHKPVGYPAEFMNRFSKEENLFVLHMSKIIFSCTYKEIHNIVLNFAQNDYVYTCFIFDLLSDSITIIANAAVQLANTKTINSESIFSGLGYLFNNFLKILEEIGVTRRMIGDEISSIRYINRIITLLDLFPDLMKQTYRFNVIKCINEMLPKLRETTHDFDGDARQLLLGLYLL